MRTLIFILSISIGEVINACPGCAGSMSNPKEARIVWILIGFIALTYIPFYLLYRMIIKNRHLNEATTSAVENNEE